MAYIYSIFCIPITAARQGFYCKKIFPTHLLTYACMKCKTKKSQDIPSSIFTMISIHKVKNTLTDFHYFTCWRQTSRFIVWNANDPRIYVFKFLLKSISKSYIFQQDFLSPNWTKHVRCEAVPVCISVAKTILRDDISAEVFGLA